MARIETPLTSGDSTSLNAHLVTVRLLGFFALAYAISWTIWLPLWMPRLGLPSLQEPVQQALGELGPLISAIVFTLLEEGPSGVLAVLRRLVLVPRRWWLVPAVVVGPFLLLGMAVAFAWILGGSSYSGAGLLNSPEFPSLSPLALFGLYLVPFALGEEPGWRGFALPRLQRRFSPLAATTVLSVGWAIWHLPMFAYWPGFSDMGLGAAAGWLVSLVLGAAILTLLFNLSGGSLLLTMLFHAAMNTAFASSQPGGVVPMVTGALISVIGVCAAWGLAREPGSPVVLT